ncbi:MAG: efflux RND transporter permease subunit [Saprospiraceae bacterium]|nr:efflux RND transporter permease subunit [Saprospiraceae bacterium]
MIILSEVIFSIIGVLFGIVIFDMSISVIMTGLGIVALGGIVVRNRILIVEFIDTLKERGYKTRDAIIGRLNPYNTGDTCHSYDTWTGSARYRIQYKL